MKRKSKLIWGISILCCIILLICGALAIKKTRTLSGVYKTPSTASDKSVNYWYFKKNGKLLYCTPQDPSGNSEDDDFWYGDVSKGTWKPLGNNKFEIKMHDVYNNDSYTIKAKRNGNKFHTYANSKSALYEWDADTSTKQPSISSSEFMDMYNRAKVSDQKGIQENGYYRPDNAPLSSASSSNRDNTSNSDSSSNIDPKTLGVLILEKTRGVTSINSGDAEYMILGKKNSYQIGFGTKDGTVSYTIDGDHVTVRDGSDDYSDASAKTYSIKGLVNEYYSSSSDKSKVDNFASKANTTDMSDQ